MESERKRNQKYYRRNREQILLRKHEHSREHADEIRARNAVYYNSHREEIRAYRSERYRAGFRREHPKEIRAAHQAVAYALRHNHLSKKPCQECGRMKVHAHHDDYSKPLEVRWLCPRHHTERHRIAALGRSEEA